MKKLTLIAALIIPLLVVAGFIVNDNARSSEPVITFYQTPLVCGAAPEIGCGSRSKPALLELEKNPAVKEAWLNRPGTVVAIVWKDGAQTGAVAKPIFEKNEIEFTELSKEEAATHRRAFREANSWYRGKDVDVLSREEATTIAASSVKFALEHKLITQDEANKIQTDVEAYFKEELVKLRTNEQLNEDNQKKFIPAMYTIGEKYIGVKRIQQAMELYQKSIMEQCKKDEACTAPGTGKDCCQKK